MKQTDWRNVKEGTPVLFRRIKDSEYEAGTWIGGCAYGALSGAFCWYLDTVSGSLARDIGASISDNGEWHIDPHYCKLANPDPRISDRASIELPESLLSTVTELAESEGVTPAEILRRALSAEQFLRRNIDAGNTLLVLEKGQTNPSRVVVFR
jgi:hypothetical protein